MSTDLYKYIFVKLIFVYNISMPIMTARRRVLSYLENHPGKSAVEIGRSLNMSAADVRHHLSILMADGRIAQMGLTRRAGRGRPVKLYGLPDHSFGDNFPALLDAVLDEFLGGLSQKQRQARVEAVADRLRRECSGVDHQASLMSRLAEVVLGLNKMHYRSRWEAGPEGPRVLLGHCPYAAILDHHPELCRMDTHQLSGCLGGAARQIARIGQAGAAQCVFSIAQGDGQHPR